MDSSGRQVMTLPDEKGLIALKFGDDFPVDNLRGFCIHLDPAKGSYTLGRSPENGPSLYDVEVPVGIFSRSQAVLTFNWDAWLNSWTVADAGLTKDGALVAYKYGCQVNGVFIRRNILGVPDAIPIDPEYSRRILIGGHPEMKILVLNCCDQTETGLNPFTEGDWGADKWQQRDPTIPPEVVDTIATGERTVGLNLDEIANPHLKTLVAVSRATGHGLADEETRIPTLLTLLAGVALSLWLTLLYVVVKSGPSFFAPADPAQPGDVAP